MWRAEDKDVIQMLKQEQGASSLTAYADSLGLSAAYMSNVMSGKKPISEGLLDHLGLEREVRYIRKSDGRKHARGPKRRWR